MTETERRYILEHKDRKFAGEIAKEIGRCRRAVRDVIRSDENSHK
jgi:hypothetical protein